MELSPSWEAASRSKNFTIFYGSRRFICTVNNSPPLFLIVSQTNPVHTALSYLFNINFNIILSYLCLYPSGFPTKTLYRFLLANIRATCYTNPTLLDCIILIIFGEQYKLWSSSLCSFLPPLSHHLSSIQIFSSVPISQTPSVYVKVK
jgi:hypothetical protein